MSRILEEQHRIEKVMGKFTHEIATEVDFEYLKPHVRAIFSRYTLQKAEGGGDRCSYEIMGNICDSARTLSMKDFLQFLAAIRKVSQHVYDHINEDYKEMTGNNLPNCENAPIPPQNAPIFPQNAPTLPQNAPTLPQNAPILPQNAPISPQNAPISPQNAPIFRQNAPITPQNAPIPPQNAPISPQNAPILPQNAPITPQNALISPQNAPISPQNAPIFRQNAPITPQNAPITPQNTPILPQNASITPQNAPITSQNALIPPQNAPIFPQNAPIFLQNASVPPQNAESLEPNTTTSGFMEICDPKEMTKPEELHSSHIVSGLRAEVAELNMVPGHINYVSLGAAVPCPSDQLPPPDNPVSIGNAAQLPSDFLENNQTPTGSSAFKATFTSPNKPLETIETIVSGLRAEVAELNMVSGHINYFSLGAAVPCPSDQLPPPDNPVSIGNAAQLPSDFLENNQTSAGSSALEATFTSPKKPLETTEREREQTSGLRKYYRSISKEADTVYKMDSSPRGHCLIINNEEFKHFSYRRGSSKDLDKLDRMFTCLGFKVLPYKNKTAREMTTLLEDFSKSPALVQISSLAVVILSHGGPHESIYGKDGALDKKSPVAGTFISRLELQHIFNGTNCPSMIGKPKLFILQACRGDMEDDRDRGNLGVTENQQESHISRDDDLSVDQPKEAVTESDYPWPDYHHRAETADMCFLHSSSLGYKSYRSKYEGSPFIQLFTEKVMKHASEKSFQDMVMAIQKDFSTKRIGTRKMTMPEYSTYLTRRWYFNPPVGES